jgi:hypothetical protein
MNPSTFAVTVSLLLFAGMLVCLEIGFRVGRRQTAESPNAHEGVGALEAAIFALLGLLLGFTFAGATSRLETRRDQIVHEANAIGTAYLRIDLLPAEEQVAMRSLFRTYLDNRLEVYSALPDLGAARARIAAASEIQRQIWNRAVASSSKDASHDVARVLLPALNEMFDITTARTIAMQTHTPSLIFMLLIAMAILAALIAGYAMSERRARSTLHMAIFAAAVSVTIYALLDLDHPRSGLIQLKNVDSAMFELRKSIK